MGSASAMGIWYLITLTSSSRNRKIRSIFFDNFFEFEYAEVYNGKEYKRKGLGLVSVDKTGVEFYKDFSDDPND